MLYKFELDHDATEEKKRKKKKKKKSVVWKVKVQLITVK